MPKSATRLEAMPEFTDALNRQSVRAVVADKISSLIASGVLAVGDELPSERDLARAWQVSRDSVRGGVQMLAGRGLLAVSHGARTRVVSDFVRDAEAAGPSAERINSYEVEDINRSRRLVELEVVGRAAERIPDETLSFLEASLAAQRRSLNKPVEFLVSDREFHFAIYREAGSPVLSDFVMQLYGYMMPNRVGAMGRFQAIDKSIADHEAILAALAARDRAETVRRFEIHIERIYRTTVQMMGR